jgi:hypothetical protein
MLHNSKFYKLFQIFSKSAWIGSLYSLPTCLRRMFFRSTRMSSLSRWTPSRREAPRNHRERQQHRQVGGLSGTHVDREAKGEQRAVCRRGGRQDVWPLPVAKVEPA